MPEKAFLGKKYTELRNFVFLDENKVDKAMGVKINNNTINILLTSSSLRVMESSIFLQFLYRVLTCHMSTGLNFADLIVWATLIFI